MPEDPVIRLAADEVASRAHRCLFTCVSFAHRCLTAESGVWKLPWDRSPWNPTGEPYWDRHSPGIGITNSDIRELFINIGR
jgi:hypothetical protein